MSIFSIFLIWFAVAALPVISTVPVWLTPGRLILCEPSNNIPPTVTGFVNLPAVVALVAEVAVAALPAQVKAESVWLHLHQAALFCVPRTPLFDATRAVAVAALPPVRMDRCCSTPGRLISPVPLKDTPTKAFVKLIDWADVA